MNTILALAWSAEDLSAFEVAANLAHDMGSHVIGLEPPSYRAVSVAWADVGMGGPFDMPMADDEEDRKRVETLREGFFRAMDSAGVPRAASAGSGGRRAVARAEQAAPLEIGWSSRRRISSCNARQTRRRCRRACSRRVVEPAGRC